MSVHVASGRPAQQAGALQALILVFTTQLPVMGLLSVVPVIPLLAQQFGGHPHAHLLLPLLVTAPSLCLALGSPIAGWLADRFGRKPLLCAATLLYGGFGFAPYWLDGLAAIILSRFLLGLSEAVIMTVSNTLMGDLYPPAPRRKWLAVQSAVGSFSGTALMFVSGLLGAAIGWRGPFVLYLLAFPALALVLLFIREPVRAKAQTGPGSGAPRDRFPLRALALICAVTLLSAIIYYVEVLQISSVLNSLGMQHSGHIGIASALAGLGVPLGALAFAKMVGWGIRQQLMAIYALFSIGLLVLGTGGSVPLAVVGAFVAQIACGLLIPALIHWCLGALHFEHRGRGVGIWTTSFFLGQFISPLLVGVLAARMGGLLPAVAVMGGMAAAGALVLGGAVRIWK